MRAVVVGAGVHGLCTAWALLRRGCAVTLVEQHELGHSRGSSHGATRITRTAYADARYVRFMQEAHREDWPRLEAAAGERLLLPADLVVFGPEGGDFLRYAEAVRDADGVERLDVPEARRRFPQLTFRGALGALHDRTGGILRADATRAALLRLLDGAEIRARTTVLGVEPGRVDTDQGPLATDLVAVCGGPWAPRLLPLALRPVRQHVAYYELGIPQGIGDFPPWYWLGPGEDGEVYGLPEHGRPGVKAARYLTSGVDDPDEVVAPADPGLDDFLAEHLSAPVRARVGAETCWFTMAAGHDPLAGLLAPGLAFFAGGSGHSFKMGPTVGRGLANLLLDGDPGVPSWPFQGSRPG